MNRNLGFKWPLIVGGFGFAVGFFGPLIFSPGANQGPLLGIFITGPLGFLLGLLGWIFSFTLKWPYPRQIFAARVCCGLILGGIVVAALIPEPEWPGRVYKIKVVNCQPSAANGEVILETIRLNEWMIKKEKPLFKTNFYSAGEVTYPMEKEPKGSFYIPGSCDDFPKDFTEIFYVDNNPSVRRDKAVLGPIPDFAKGLVTR